MSVTKMTKLDVSQLATSEDDDAKISQFMVDGRRSGLVVYGMWDAMWENNGSIPLSRYL